MGDDGAIYTSHNAVLTFSGNSNFFNNSVGFYGGAISAKDNTSLSFIGTSNFTHNLAGFGGGAINITKTLYLLSMKPATFPTTQQNSLVVQSMHQTVLYLLQWNQQLLQQFISFWWW